MKTQMIKKVSVIAVAILMITGSNLYAQQGRNYARQAQRLDQGQGMYQRQACIIPDLTEDQETKIESLRLNQMKEMTAYRNQMNELRAKKQTLMSTGSSDLKEINTVIDQMTDLNNKKMKASAKHRQEVRNLLTDEQKVVFDSRPAYGRGYGKGNERGRGGRNACSYGTGRGQMRTNF